MYLHVDKHTKSGTRVVMFGSDRDQIGKSLLSKRIFCIETDNEIMKDPVK